MIHVATPWVRLAQTGLWSLTYLRPHAICHYSTDNYYRVLGVRSKASSQEIRDAFLKLSKQTHPDVLDNTPECHKHYLKINEAYQVLVKPKSRQEYDNIIFGDFHGESQSTAHGRGRFAANDLVFVNNRFSNVSGGKRNSSAYSFGRTLWYSCLSLLGAFVIGSVVLVLLSPETKYQYKSKQEMDKWQLMWAGQERGLTVFYFSKEDEPQGRTVLVATKEEGDTPDDFRYRVLSSVSEHSFQAQR